MHKEKKHTLRHTHTGICTWLSKHLTPIYNMVPQCRQFFFHTFSLTFLLTLAAPKQWEWRNQPSSEITYQKCYWTRFSHWTRGSRCNSNSWASRNRGSRQLGRGCKQIQKQKPKATSKGNTQARANPKKKATLKSTPASRTKTKTKRQMRFKQQKRTTKQWIKNKNKQTYIKQKKRINSFKHN